MVKKKPKGLIIAALIFLVTILVAVFIIFKDNGHKKNIEEVAMTEQPSDTLVLRDIANYVYDLESPAELENFSTVGKFKSKSGLYSCKLDKNNEYSVTVRKKLNSLGDFSNIKNIKFSFAVLSASPIGSAVAVVSIEDKNGKAIFWEGKEIKNNSGSWQRISLNFEIPNEALKPDCDIKIYVWNKKSEEFFIDDLEVKINGLVSAKLFSAGYIPERNIFESFDVPGKNENPNNYSEEVVHAGKMSFLLTNKVTYSPSITRRVSEVIDSELKLVTMSMWVNQQDDDNELVLVATIKNTEGKEYFWQGRSTEKGFFPQGVWTKHRAQFKLPFEQIKPEDIISIYAWNKGGKNVYVDDFLVVFGETNVRSGSQPAVDLTTNVDVPYVFQPSRAPYRTKYLSKWLPTEVKTGANYNLFSDVLYPSNLFSSGNFINTGAGKDELVSLSVDGFMAIYQYCDTEKKMKQLLNQKISDYLPFDKNAILTKGTIVNGGPDNLFYVDIQNHRLFAGQFVSKGDGCEPGASKANFNVLFELKGESFTNLISDTYTACVVSDFVGDKKSEVLFLDFNSGSFLLLGLMENQLVKIAEAESKFFESKATEDIYISTYARNNDENALLYFSKPGPQLLNSCVAFSDRSSEGVLITEVDGDWNKNSSGKLFPGQYVSSFNEILILNRDWKFDLAFGHTDVNGISIESRIEFTGFLSGYNPKYYEDIKLVPGNFIQNDKSMILVVYGNCNDKAFPVSICKNYDSVSGWKLRNEIYYFKD